MGNKNFYQLSNKEMMTEAIIRNSFEYIEVIGKGGFGKVWKVYNKKYKKEYAMKEMFKKRIIDTNSEKAILSERELLGRMYHLFIVNMQFAYQDKDILYLGLDLLKGGDLRYHLCINKRFTEEQTQFFAACIILGLEYIHSNNIIHRDIKPENLILDYKGYLKITDFGIAKDYAPDNYKETSGTPGYMSPEVLSCLNHSFTADYYALGIICFECMFGGRPFKSRSRKEVKEEVILSHIDIKESDVPKGWSFNAADFINKLLIKQPNNRLGYKGIHELKNHPWLKFYNWKDLYLEKIKSPYIPHGQCNFDPFYCNYIEKLDEKTKERYEQIVNSLTYATVFNNYGMFNRQIPSFNSKVENECIDPHRIFSLLEEKEKKAFDIQFEKKIAHHNRKAVSLTENQLNKITNDITTQQSTKASCTNVNNNTDNNNCNINEKRSRNKNNNNILGDGLTKKKIVHKSHYSMYNFDYFTKNLTHKKA